MIGLGLRLRDWPTGGLTWRDLAAILRHLPGDSAFKRAKFPGRPSGDDVRWMLRRVEHTLRVLVWQNSGQKDSPEPVPLRWDCEPPDEEEKPDEMGLDEVDAVMERNRRLALGN